MSVCKQVYDYTRQVIALAQKTEKNAADIQEVRQQLKDLTATVQRLEFEIRHDRSMAAKDREAADKDRGLLLVRLENQLLRFERRLPPPPHSSQTDVDS